MQLHQRKFPFVIIFVNLEELIRWIHCDGTITFGSELNGRRHFHFIQWITIFKKSWMRSMLIKCPIKTSKKKRIISIRKKKCSGEGGQGHYKFLLKVSRIYSMEMNDMTASIVVVVLWLLRFQCAFMKLVRKCADVIVDLCCPIFSLQFSFPFSLWQLKRPHMHYSMCVILHSSRSRAHTPAPAQHISILFRKQMLQMPYVMPRPQAPQPATRIQYQTQIVSFLCAHNVIYYLMWTRLSAVATIKCIIILKFILHFHYTFAFGRHACNLQPGAAAMCLLMSFSLCNVQVSDSIFFSFIIIIYFRIAVDRFELNVCGKWKRDRNRGKRN